MKNIELIVIIVLFFLSSVLKAQVSVNINIGSSLLWGPVVYYEERYYYLPDVEAYYDLQSSMFIYYWGGIWVRRAYLPAQYRNYDLYRGYKVVLHNYHGNTPYSSFNEHKNKYIKGYHGVLQESIRDNPSGGYNRTQAPSSKVNSHTNSRRSGINNNHHDMKGHTNGGNNAVNKGKR